MTPEERGPMPVAFDIAEHIKRALASPQIDLRGADPQYQRVRIVAFVPDSGQVVADVQTYRRPADFPGLADDLVDLARTSDELLDKVPFAFTESDGAVIRQTTAKAIVNRQAFGGRRPGSLARDREASRRALEELYQVWTLSGLSQADFCSQQGIKLSRLKYAIKRHCGEINGHGDL